MKNKLIIAALLAAGAAGTQTTPASAGQACVWTWEQDQAGIGPSICDPDPNGPYTTLNIIQVPDYQECVNSGASAIYPGQPSGTWKCINVDY